MRYLALASLVLILACSDPADPVAQYSIDTSAPVYELPGKQQPAAIRYAVHNRSSRPLYVSCCGDRLSVDVQRLGIRKGEYLAVGACPADRPWWPIVIQPGESREATAHVWRPGVAQIVLGVSTEMYSGPVDELRSNVFVVK